MAWADWVQTVGPWVGVVLIQWRFIFLQQKRINTQQAMQNMEKLQQLSEGHERSC